MSVPYRPLGMITEIIEQMDLEVTYTFEDLVFISHNAFLLQMGQNGETVYLYFNEESQSDKRDSITSQLIQLGKQREIVFIQRGTYVMKPRKDEQLDIHFTQNAATV